MITDDLLTILTLNGEIYNHMILRNELIEKHNVKFKTDHSDSEVVLQGYLVWGTDILNKLEGMYAFTILDLKNNKILIARDKLGEKPI